MLRPSALSGEAERARATSLTPSSSIRARRTRDPDTAFSSTTINSTVALQLRFPDVAQEQLPTLRPDVPLPLPQNLPRLQRHPRLRMIRHHPRRKFVSIPRSLRFRGVQITIRRTG
jgi:hypothetical protein